LPHLRQLELVCSDGDRHLCSAYQWERFIIDRLPSLSTFNFKFQFQYINLDEEILLAPFRTAFWVNKNRQWYVACDRRYSLLFTVPRFAPHAIVYPNVPILPNMTTLPIEQNAIFYQHITELTLGANSVSLYQYGQVKMLTLLSFNIDEKIIDLCQVEYLSVQIPQRWSLHELIQLIKKSMPRLHCLKLDSAFFIESSAAVVPLAQIRTLYWSYLASKLENNNLDLSYFFPRVERLKITVNTRGQMALLIDLFKHLSSGSFYVINCQIGVKEKLREPPVTREWLINNTRRLARRTDNSFTCRFDSHHLHWLHLWISDDDEHENKVCRDSTYSYINCLLLKCFNLFSSQSCRQMTKKRQKAVAGGVAACHDAH
jgi:hypothetical protein